MVAASSATTTRLAQNAFGGMTADQVRFVGAIGADPGVIVVAADSPFQTLGDMVAAIKADPGSVAFAGGSAAGGFDHLKVLMMKCRRVRRCPRHQVYRRRWRRRCDHPDDRRLHPGDDRRHVRDRRLPEDRARCARWRPDRRAGARLRGYPDRDGTGL
jgi:hypothetical protein